MPTETYVLLPYKQMQNIAFSVEGIITSGISDLTRVTRKVLLRGCRCIEIDVWDGEARSVSDEAESKSNEEKRHRFRPHVPETISNHSPFKHLHKEKSSPTSTPPETDDINESLDMPAPWISSSTAIQAEPRVLHGYTLTKEVPFRDVCQAIREAAFLKRYDDRYEAKSRR